MAAFNSTFHTQNYYIPSRYGALSPLLSTSLPYDLPSTTAASNANLLSDRLLSPLYNPRTKPASLLTTNGLSHYNAFSNPNTFSDPLFNDDTDILLSNRLKFLNSNDRLRNDQNGQNQLRKQNNKKIHKDDKLEIPEDELYTNKIDRRLSKVPISKNKLNKSNRDHFQQNSQLNSRISNNTSNSNNSRQTNQIRSRDSNYSNFITNDNFNNNNNNQFQNGQYPPPQPQNRNNFYNNNSNKNSEHNFNVEAINNHNNNNNNNFKYNNSFQDNPIENKPIRRKDNQNQPTPQQQQQGFKGHQQPNQNKQQRQQYPDQNDYPNPNSQQSFHDDYDENDDFEDDYQDNNFNNNNNNDNNSRNLNNFNNNNNNNNNNNRNPNSFNNNMNNHHNNNINNNANRNPNNFNNNNNNNGNNFNNDDDYDDGNQQMLIYREIPKNNPNFNNNNNKNSNNNLPHNELNSRDSNNNNQIRVNHDTKNLLKGNSADIDITTVSSMLSSVNQSPDANKIESHRQTPFGQSTNIKKRKSTNKLIQNGNNSVNSKETVPSISTARSNIRDLNLNLEILNGNEENDANNQYRTYNPEDDPNMSRLQYYREDTNQTIYRRQSMARIKPVVVKGDVAFGKDSVVSESKKSKSDKEEKRKAYGNLVQRRNNQLSLEGGNKQPVYSENEKHKKSSQFEARKVYSRLVKEINDDEYFKREQNEVVKSILPQIEKRGENIVKEKKQKLQKLKKKSAYSDYVKDRNQVLIEDQRRQRDMKAREMRAQEYDDLLRDTYAEKYGADTVKPGNRRKSYFIDLKDDSSGDPIYSNENSYRRMYAGNVYGDNLSSYNI